MREMLAKQWGQAPMQYEPGRCPCGALLSRYNPYVLCRVCYRKTRVGDRLPEIGRRRCLGRGPLLRETYPERS